MPMDRIWGLAHTDAKVDHDAPLWARCINFARAARGHKLMAVSSTYDATTGKVTLQHPELETLTVNPDEPADATALVEWATKISNPDRSLLARVFRPLDRPLTDSNTPSLSIHTNASLRALSDAVGSPLDQRRFRGNIWVDGFDAWEEFDWIGKRIRIGTAEFDITKPVERCMATTVNPDTGISDQPTLDTLKTKWGHIDFGVLGVVVKAGEIKIDDKVEVL